jgi:AAA+ ATPase superfamily predicted ATPase
MEFVDRQRELAFLDSHFKSQKAEFLVIWGRRRVGKTALLQSFVAKRPVAYHMAVRTTPADELRRLSARLAEFFADDLLRAQPMGSWEALFAYLAGRKGRFGLVLDEFPYLVEASPELPALLQEAWDTRLSKTGIRLIICGSSISMMERTLFAPSAPLFGRRTGQWKVQPFGPLELGLLLGGSLVERIELFSVIGGVPMYARLFDRRSDLATNIRKRILAKGEVLYEEVPFLLRQELREPRVYQAILAAVAAGAHRFSELSSKTGLNRANLVRYLAQLEELELVRREVPVTEEKPHKSRKGLYRIADPFVRFWYRYVYPNLDRLELQDAGRVLRERVLPDLHGFVAAGVEPILAELFRTGPLKKLVPFRVAHAGRHWSRTEEFDLVLFDQARERALIGEIKWSRKPVHPGLLADLRRRVEASRVFAGMRLTLALVSRSGFSPAPRTRRAERYVDLSAELP